MASSARSYVFGSGEDRGSQQSKNLKGGAGLLGDDSSSDSSSSDSDSDISDAEGTQNFLSKINAATATKKAKASESSANTSTKKSAPEATPRPNTVEPAQKNGAKATNKSPAVSSSQHKMAAAKKESAKDDTDSTSSESSSEEDNAQAKNLKQAVEPTKANLKPKPQDDSTTSDSSSSDDSDSEEEAEKKAAPSKSSSEKKSVPAPKQDSSSSESSDSDESGDEDKNAGAKLGSKSGKMMAPLTKAGDDSSSESDGQSDEEAANAKSSAPKASNVQAQVSKPTKVATKETAPSFESQSGSDSESSEEEDKQSLKTKATPKKAAVSAVLNGDAKSRDASSATKAPKVANGAAEESSSEDESDVEMADESFALARTDDADSGAVEEFVREGFQLRKASENTQATEVLDMFKKAKREGKQIWYFTTPASVPISVIEKMEFPMKNAQTGDSIVSHDGVDYGVDLGASGKPSTFQILVPAKKGASYGIVDRPVDHTMHLKRITQLAATDFTAKPKAEISYSKPPRAQPANLKRRFTPIGVPTPILPPPVPNPSKVSADIPMVDAVSEGKGGDQEPAKKSKKRKLAEDGAKTSKGEKKAKKAKTSSETQVAKASPGVSLSSSQPVKKASPVPVPNPGGRAPSLSQPTPSASTPATGSKKSKSGDKANGTPVGGTPSSKTKKSKSAKSDSSIRQTPIPIPTIPGMKK